MRGSERWSLLDGELLRRRCAARTMLDHYLDRLVDIFDLSLAPPSYSVESLPTPSPTRKHSASTSADTYTTMDAATSPRARSRECTIGGNFNKPHKVSIAERVRELLLRSTRPGSSKTRTRKTVAVCNDSMKSNNAPDATELRLSWLPERTKIASKEPQDATWTERDEQDRQLECGYQCLADEAAI